MKWILFDRTVNQLGRIFLRHNAMGLSVVLEKRRWTARPCRFAQPFIRNVNANLGEKLERDEIAIWCADLYLSKFPGLFTLHGTRTVYVTKKYATRV